MLVALIVELFCHDPSKNVPFTQTKIIGFQFLLGYKVEQSKSEDIELDDVYVSLVDDPISSSIESMMSFMSDHVDQ